MTHAESLDRLHALAIMARGIRVAAPESRVLYHGLMAVNSIRHYHAVDHASLESGTPGYGFVLEQTRRAFSSACEAVGIQADRDGHHNL